MFRDFLIRVNVTITVIFILLTAPVTTIIIYTNYQSNQVLADENSRKFIQNSVQENIDNVTNLLNPMLAMLSTFGTLMRDQPKYFHEDIAADYLHQIVISNDAVYAAYVGFQDGQFREVWRAIPDKPVYGRAVPKTTRFVSRYIADENAHPIDHYQLYADWRVPVDEFSGPSQYDVRTRGFYRQAMQSPELQVSDPYIFGSSGEMGITLSAQVIDTKGGPPIGIAAIDLTLDTLSRFLAEHRVTAHSLTLIADTSGVLVAHPDPDKAVISTPNGLIRNQVMKLGDERITMALLERERSHSDRVVFRAGPDQAEYIGVFSPFPADFKKPWELITVTPTDDFVGEINAVNRKLLLFGIGTFILQILLIYPLSRSLSRPLERLVIQVTNIRNLVYGSNIRTRSRVREIRQLYDATENLEKTIESFTSYVPRGLVKELLGTGISAKIGVENRYLTIFFTDLEGFSTLSEAEPSQQLLRRVSDYFSVLTRAIEAEQGTVDKFIGDAVMAFWGAPRTQSDHAYNACVAAVRSQRRMVTLNAAWAREGLPPLIVRIGIHCDAVLVGNIGSADRLSYTVMGDGVNVSARLEGINKEWGTRTCVSHHVFRAAGERLWLRPIDTVTVKGRKGELLIYELIAVRDGDSEVAATEAEISLCTQTTDAYAHFAADRFEAASAGYKAILEQFPTDIVAQKLLAKCQHHLYTITHSSDQGSR